MKSNEEPDSSNGDSESSSEESDSSNESENTEFKMEYDAMTRHRICKRSPDEDFCN